jgi:hypothetical protein
MSTGNQNDPANQITAATETTPATSAKESNENDIHMKSDPATFKDKDQIASEKLRYDNADQIYPK